MRYFEKIFLFHCIENLSAVLDVEYCKQSPLFVLLEVLSLVSPNAYYPIMRTANKVEESVLFISISGLQCLSSTFLYLFYSSFLVRCCTIYLIAVSDFKCNKFTFLMNIIFLKNILPFTKRPSFIPPRDIKILYTTPLLSVAQGII